MAQANSAPALPPSEVDTGRQIRIVNARTFILSDGIWLDTAYDPESVPVTKISYLSAEYFELAYSSADAAAALALGEQVILIVDGKAYQVVNDGIVPVITRQPVGTAVHRPTDTVEAQTTPVAATPQPSSTPAAAQPTPERAIPNPICGAALLPLLLVLLLKKH